MFITCNLYYICYVYYKINMFWEFLKFVIVFFAVSSRSWTSCSAYGHARCGSILKAWFRTNIQHLILFFPLQCFFVQVSSWERNHHKLVLFADVAYKTISASYAVKYLCYAVKHSYYAIWNLKTFVQTNQLRWHQLLDLIFATNRKITT